jgi:hypothetical protein
MNYPELSRAGSHGTSGVGVVIVLDVRYVSLITCVIALAVSPHSLPFSRLQHAQLNNDPYLSFLKPSHEIT